MVWMKPKKFFSMFSSLNGFMYILETAKMLQFVIYPYACDPFISLFSPAYTHCSAAIFGWHA